jgi:predicted dehydrogenase
MLNKEKINWGILGTGKAAYNFAKALSITKNAELVAVASRDEGRAKNFANKFGLLLYFSDYSHLASSSEVDVIYIATPNSCHKDNAVLCLNAGKGVLIEKPFTTNAKDAEILIDLAKKNNLFLMEAMWTRFIPAFNKVEQLIKSGEIGEVMSFQATIGQPSEINKNNNLFKKSMGGGSLLDLAVYPIFWAQYFLGRPIRAQGDLYCGDTDVDLTSSIILSYNKGKYANISSSIITRLISDGVIYGTKGYIEICPPLYCPTVINVIKYGGVNKIKSKKTFFNRIVDRLKKNTLARNLYVNHLWLGQRVLGNVKKTTIRMPIKGNGMQYMIDEVSNYLINQTTEDNLVTLTITINSLKIIDSIKCNSPLLNNG